MSKWLQNVYYFVLGSILLLSSTALAINGRTTYQAKIYKPDGLPLEAVSVNFRFTVLDPSSSCVLYVEDYAAVNMIGSGGLTSFSLGMGTRTYPASGPVTFASVFDNSTPSYVCQVPGVYNPIPTDNRKIVMQFNEGTGWQTLPAMAINSVPYSMYSAKAQNAQQLNGKADTSFVEYSALAALNCQSNEAIKFNGVSFSCIAVGVSSSGISSVTTSGTVLTTTGTASAPVISINVASMSSDGYLTSVDYAEFKAKLSASSTQIVNTLGYAPVSGAAVSSQIQASQLSGDVSGTVSANVVQSVGGKTAAQVSTSVNDTLAATSSATADTIVKRNSSGNITVNDIYANAAKVNYVDIYKPSTSFNIRLEAPTSLAANYTLALPTTSGSVGQVLSTDGSGNLSWINPSTGSVTSVSATAPLSSTGGATPTISISQATSSTNGYLSSTDWNTFNNKQQATSAAIIATLGYTPANATSSTQWTTNGSHIYYSTGNVGIGVSNPVHALDVFGTIRAGAANNGSVSMGSDGNAFMELREYDNAGTPYIDFANDNSTDYDARFVLSSDDTFELNGAMFGIGLRPTAVLSLAAGTATYGPLKFASGTLLTSPQSGTMEYDGSNFYLTDGANQRRVIATGSVQGSIDNASNINSSSNITMTPNNSVIVSSTAASTDANTGALIVKGGLGVVGTTNIGGNLNVSGSSVIDGSLRLSSMTSGSVLFAGSNGTVTQDNANFYWDGGNRRLGVGTISPSSTLEVSGTTTISNSHNAILKASAGSPYDPGDLIWQNNDGTERARIHSNTAVSGSIYFAVGPSISTKMMINPEGNVGIGTSTLTGGSSNTAIDGLLQIKGNDDSTLLHLRGQNTDYSGLKVKVGPSNISGGSDYYDITIRPSVGPGVATVSDQVILRANNTYSRTYADVILNPNGGNVGIGTTSPGAKLHVSGSALFQNGGTDGNRAQGATINIGGGAYVSGTDPSDSNRNLALTTNTNNTGVVLTLRNTARSIFWDIVGQGTGNDRLDFNTYNGGAYSTKFSLEGTTGNVGIGTTAPSAVLNVKGGQTADTAPLGLLRLQNLFTGSGTGNRNAVGLEFANGDAGSTNTTMGGIYLDTADVSTANMKFYTYTGASNTEKVRITGTGNVGIGTASPQTKFHIESTTNTDLLLKETSQLANKKSFLIRNSLSDLKIGRVDDIFSTFTEYLTIKDGGNVGIGTTSPEANLHVNDRGIADDGQSKLKIGTGTVSQATVTIISNDSTNSFSVWDDNNLVTPRFLIQRSGNVGIGMTTPAYKLQVNAAAAIGDAVSGNSDASLTPLINHYLGGTGDIGAGSVAYILLAYNQTAGSGITASGFDGQIYSYRGSAGTWNNATRMDVALKTAYDAPAVHRFSVDGPLANAVVVTLTYSGTSYIGVQVPSSSAMDYYITGRFWGFKPILLDSVNHGASISAVTEVSKPLIATVGGNVGIGTGAPISKLQVNGGIKQPNYGQLVSIWDGTTRTTTMPAFLTSTYIDAHQDETYTWRGIGPRLKDTAGCNGGPSANYFFDGYDTTWNGTYRMTLGKLNGTTYLAEIEWKGWGTNLRDASGTVVSTGSNQGTVQATLAWDGSTWMLQHMQGQVGATPFSCH